MRRGSQNYKVSFRLKQQVRTYRRAARSIQASAFLVTGTKGSFGDEFKGCSTRNAVVQAAAVARHERRVRQ